MTVTPLSGRGGERYRFDRFELQPAARRLLVEGREAKVGARAFDVLLALVERPGRVVGKDELFATVWPGVVVEEANLAVQISALRKLLGGGLIATVAGRGYQFTGTLEPLAAAPSDGAAPAPAHPVVPRAATPMIGREAELSTLAEVLAGHRLVTITGTGGIGKTRLAQAWCEGPGVGERIVWIDLAGLADAALLPATVLAHMKMAAGTAGKEAEAPAAERAQPGEASAALARLGEAVAPLVLTLVLDNAEPIVDEVAALAKLLLDAAPRLRMLATSQVPLRLQAERVVRLGPLAVPSGRVTPAEALAHAGVLLFVERARAADPQFELAAGNVTSVVEICRRLDGLPLALELAAARVATIGVNALAAALGAALDARDSPLGEGHRGAPARHRTLRAALEWSHALLDAPSRRLFRRLGLFAGGFTLAAAQAVAVDERAGEEPVADGGHDRDRQRDQSWPRVHDATLDTWGVTSTLGRLVEHSLVAKDGAEPPRFSLLESARLFALEQLERAGETNTVRARHLGWCQAFVHEVLGNGEAPPAPGAAARITLEYANLRGALEQALAPGSISREAGAALAVALLPYWQHIDADDERRHWTASGRPAGASTDAASAAPAPVAAEAMARATAETTAHETSQATAQATARRVLEHLFADDVVGAGTGLDADAVIALARRAAGEGVQNVDQAVHELERAVALASAVRGRAGAEVDADVDAHADAAGPAALDAFVAETLSEAARRAGRGDVERAGADLDRALTALELRETRQREHLARARQALLEAALQQDLNRGDGLAAARRVRALAALEDPTQPTRAPVYREREAALLAEGLERGAVPSLAAAADLLRARIAETGPPDPAAAVGGAPADAWRDAAIDLARALNRLSQHEGNEGTSREAGHLCEQVLAVTARDTDPLRWATLHLEWSRALGREGARRGDASLLSEALVHCRLALQERRRERLPCDWAETMALLAILEGRAGALATDTAHLEAAVRAGRESLLEFTRERAPQRWASVQGTIADALSQWARRDGSMARRQQAVAAMRAALGELTPEGTPRQWAAAQSNLGIELAAIGGAQPGPEGVETLQAAVDAYRAALRVLSLQASPATWAAVQHNLGGALRLLGERENGTQSLREAVLAFDEALKHHTRESAPGHWAAGQNDRALALLAHGRRDRRRDLIEHAVAGLRAALLERQCATAPFDWATTQGDIAEALAAWAELDDDPKPMRAAAEAAEAALAKLPRETAPDEHARVAALLAHARAWLAERARLR
jgi:predicted ATPase/DNA-binding winged helix-turn-helix (wHTH) protein